MKANTVTKRIASRSAPVAGPSSVEFWLLIDGEWVQATGRKCSPRLRLQKLVEALWDDPRRQFCLYTNADLVADLREWYGFKSCEEEVSKAAKAAGLRKVPHERRVVRKLLARNGKLTKGFVWFIPTESRAYPEMPIDFKSERGVRNRYNRQRVFRKEPKLIDALAKVSKHSQKIS